MQSLNVTSFGSIGAAANYTVMDVWNQVILCTLAWQNIAEFINQSMYYGVE